MPRRNLTQATDQLTLWRPTDAPDAFRKAVEIVHSQPKAPLSLVQRKMLNALLKNAVAKDADEKGFWEINLRDLEFDIAFDSKNREHIKEAARALMRVVFEWDVMAPDKRKGHWKASVLIPDVELHPEVMRYQISSHLHDLLRKPEIYALIDMVIVKKFRRASSLALWEYCTRYERLGITAEADWRKMRDMIVTDAAGTTTYEQYKYFKDKVLKPSVAEINAVSRHVVELVERKVGRAISTIRFKVELKPGEAGTASDAEVQDLDLLGDIAKLGVPMSEAKRLMRGHGPASLRAALDYTRKRLGDKKAQPLNNPAAYFRNALAHNYASSDASEASPVGQAAQPAKASRPKVDLKEALLVQRMQEAEGYFRELDTGDQQELMKRYNDQASVALRLGQKPKKAAEMAFRRWVALDVWGEPSPEDLVEFAQQTLAAAATA